MTKQEIVEQVARRTGVEKTASRIVIDEAINVIVENLCEGKSIHIRGLFTLHPMKRAEKPARHFSKGTEILIPEHYAPHAKFSADIKQRMKKLTSVK